MHALVLVGVMTRLPVLVHRSAHVRVTEFILAALFLLPPHVTQLGEFGPRDEEGEHLACLCDVIDVWQLLWRLLLRELQLFVDFSHGTSAEP